MIIIPGPNVYFQAPSAGGYTAFATRFTSDDNLISTSSLGVSNSKSGSFSGWIRSRTNGNNEFLLINSGLDVRIYKNNVGRFGFSLSDITAADAIIMTTSSSIEGNVWHHILATWDTNNTSSCNILLDGVEDVIKTTINGITNINYNFTEWRLPYAALPIEMDLCEIWFAPSQLLSLPSDLTKFRDGDGKPVNLGTNGEIPTGISPAIYFKSDFNNFGTNYGTGGNFVIVSGSLASTTPP